MEQKYDSYTTEDFKVWELLYKRQIPALNNMADPQWLNGLHRIGFKAMEIPRFDQVNKALAETTGWEIVVVPGLVADKTFFELLLDKKFPCTTWLRKLEELDYLEEPDMFHDVFAHVPLLTNKSYCGFLSGLADIALDHIDDAWAIELLSRLYWFTIEFGLIKTTEGLRIYGAGILSSKGESYFCLEDEQVPRYPYEVGHIMDTSYIKSEFQKRYFVIDNYEQLFGSLSEVRSQLDARLKEKNKEQV